MTPRVAFIINPKSSAKNHDKIIEQLRRQMPDATVFISASRQATDDFMEKMAAAVDIFVAVGGDGTISAVARNLVDTEKILAIFPAGSGNGFSNETHFSQNLEELLGKISRRETRLIDTFTVNGNLSVNVSGAGFDSAVVEEFEKTSRGFANYIKVSLQMFFRYKPITVAFHNPELKQYNGEYLMLNVANTRQFGNHAYIAPHASKSDGLAEVILVKKFPLHYAPGFAYRMFTKRLKNDRYITFLSRENLEVSVSTDSWHLDGDFHRIPSPVFIKVKPRSLKILT